MSDEPQEAAAEEAPRREGGPRAFLPRYTRAWYILGESDELGEAPIQRTLFGVPYVLFRDGSGAPGALLDRCPHRNAPLSLGRVTAGRLECAYHGWQFDAGGTCRLIPSLTGPSEGRGRRAPALAVRERDGFLWVYGQPDVAPDSEPHAFALLGKPGYTTVRRRVKARGTLYSTIENALDVPHTAFLHKGLFRSESRGVTIEAHVHRTADRVEAEYVGEPRPPGIVARILSPSGGVVTHFDRFLLPSIAQVEYRIGEENHILVDSVMTPVSDFETHIYAVVSYRMRIPGWVVKPVLEPLALQVFAQDAEMLGRQTDNVTQFGGELFLSTEIDVLGKHIRRLLRSAERGEVVSEERGSVKLVV